MAEIIVTTSGKGGVGKTTATANIGAALAKLGYMVVLIDSDVGLRNLDVTMGKEQMVVYDFLDVIEGRCSLKQAALQDEEQEGLYLLPASQTRDKMSVTPDMMIRLCEMLAKTFDFILIDCPAGIEQGFQNAIAAANRALVVTTPDVAAIRDADRVIGLLEKNGIQQILLLINRIRVDMIKKGDMINIDNVIDVLGVDTIGLVPEDERVIACNAHGKLVINDARSLAGKAYQNVARRLCGEKVPIAPFEKGSGWRKKLRKLFR